MPETIAVIPPSEFEVLQGVPKIRNRMAELLRRPELTARQCYYYLQSGYWPGVNRGGRWELRPCRVLEELRREEDAAIGARRARLAAAKAACNGEPRPSEEPRRKRRRGRPRRRLPPQQTGGGDAHVRQTPKADE
jgi:hypothetical protein